VSGLLVLEQCLNGLQYGVMLFLMAAGLTLVFGIMNLVNLAHGSLYMVGAYFATAAYGWTGSFVVGVVFALIATLAVGMLVEVIALRTLYERDHLDQVLATFGLILFFNEAVAIVWGRTALFTTVPPALAGHLTLLPGLRYPAYRAVIILVGLAVALLLYVIVSRTRLGMLIRAWPRSVSTCGCSTRWCSASAPRWPRSAASWPGRSTRCSPAWAMTSSSRSSS
jgi:branched-chain amino acid transport system permease protein